MSSVTGRCNCSAVSVEVKDGVPESTVVSRCTNCGMSSGNLFAILFFAARDRVVISGQDHIQYYRDMGHRRRQHRAQAFLRPLCPIYGFVEGKEDRILIRATLFEPKMLPEPTLELYSKHFEVWEKPHAEAAVFERMTPGLA
ncbi:hypothetical protein JCM3770_005498 [Rhodotorula araucariae]